MNAIPFIAHSAGEAVARIRAQLGPEAVVVNVRKLPAGGLSRLWQRPRIEVMAGVPDHAETRRGKTFEPEPPASPLLNVRESDESITVPPPEMTAAPTANATPRSTQRFIMPNLRTDGWRSGSVLESMGINPLPVERVLAALRENYGNNAPADLRDELVLTRTIMTRFWTPLEAGHARPRVLVGTPGSGKTTALGKWLTQAVLLEGASARVWRLDVPRANTAEALSVHCEILGIPVERSWQPEMYPEEDNLFIDLPGVETGDANGMAELKMLLAALPGAGVSLVLNAAYDSSLLQAQLRAFASLPITDLIFTHLDEETRWSRLWNFVLGTNYPISFLGSGQNIPGQFLRASAEHLFPAEMAATPDRWTAETRWQTPCSANA